MLTKSVRHATTALYTMKTVDINIHERSVTKLIKRGNLSGSFVVGKYRFSPYTACEHGCMYCDGRAERYYVEGEFDKDIIVRTNASDLLGAELPKLREKGFISLGSGVSDVYQPIEKELELTRSCAAALAQHTHPVTVMTKSSLIIRDLDVWRRVEAGFMMLVSLTFADDQTRQVFEPAAGSVEERLEALSVFKSAGCFTGVLAMPLLPYITDTDEHVGRLYEKLKAVKPDFIMPAGLTLRPGRQKQFFLSRLAKYRPDIVPAYEEIYGEDRPSGVVTRNYQESLYRRLNKHVRASGIPFLVPHGIFAPRLHLYDSLQVLLAHMDEIYASRGVATKELQSARRRYVDWICDRKRFYNRRRNYPFTELDEELIRAASDGTLRSVLENDKLLGFVRRVLSGAIFDYAEVELRD